MTDPTDRFAAQFNDAVAKREKRAAEAALTAFRAYVDQLGAEVREGAGPENAFARAKVQSAVGRVLRAHNFPEVQANRLVELVGAGNYRINRPNDKGLVDVVIFTPENFTVLDIPIEVILRDDLHPGML